MAFSSSAKKAIDIMIPAAGCGFIAWYYIGRGKDRDIKYILFVMVLVGLALYAITSQLTALALAKALSGVKPAQQEKIMANNGITAAAFNALQSKAKTIYGAFHDSSFTEDEDLAINTFNECATPSEVKSVCEIYQQLYNKSVRAEFESYVTAVDLWANPLKDIVKTNWF